MGVDVSGAAVLPDVAYLLDAPPHEDRPADAPLTIGVGVMSYHGWREDKAGAAMYEDYVSKLTRLVEWLAERGRRVRLLVGEDSDWRTVRNLQGRLSAKASAALDPVPEMANLHDLMREIAATDIVVATRFHVAICALKLARPTVSLSYGFKNDAALTAAGLDGFFQRVEYFDFDLLKEHLMKLEGDRLRYAALVRERVAGFEARLRAKDALLPAAMLP
jgi:polysaccharide pyruvyl transferase WcaK-like protein